MDTRLRNVIESWHLFNETERNIIFHKTLISLAEHGERRWWWVLRDQNAIIIGADTPHIIGG